MSEQINFGKLSSTMKEEITNVMNLVADRHLSPTSKQKKLRGHALHKLCMLYVDNFSSKDFKELPQDIQGTIDAVDCPYIKWDDILPAFVCFESFHKNKKTHPIESEHDKVINACMLCKKGKSDAIKYRVEEGFRKKGINSIFNLTNLLLRMDIEGAVAQIFLCQAKQFTDDEIIISPDCIHLKCPNLDKELVLIEEYCTSQIDPHTLKPPCRWLIAPFLRVPIKPSPEAKAVMEEIAQLEHDEETEIKEVDATVIEAEHEPVEEEQTKLTELESIEEDESIAVDLDNPKTARDIIAKENEEKEEKEEE